MPPFPTFEEWVRLHDVRPIEDVRRAAELSFHGRTQLFELARRGEIAFVKNGRKNGLTAPAIYELARRLVDAAKDQEAE